MPFQVELASQPRKFIKKLPSSELSRVIKKLDELSTDPIPKGARIVEDRPEKTYRLRVGNIRILYTVFWDEELVLISAIDRRSKVYR